LSEAAYAVQVDESLTDLAALAEHLERGDGCLLAHLADPLIVEPFDGLTERRQPVASASDVSGIAAA
jgi:hypothetical protein